jgi:hypothetical protein
MIRLVRHLSGSNLFPERVNLMHHRDRFHLPSKKFFGCKVAFGSGRDEIAFASTIRPAPLSSADSYLNALLIRSMRTKPRQPAAAGRVTHKCRE